MTQKRKWWAALLSAVLSCGLVYAVYVLQLKQVEMQQNVQVVVPRHFIDAGTLISPDDLAMKPIMRAAFDPDMATRIDDVAGMETAVPLGGGEPVLMWKLDRFHLMPDSDEFTFRIPKSYVLSISSGIRAGDRVKIYVSGPEGPRLLFAEDIVVASVRSASNTEISDPAGDHLIHRARGEYEQMYVSRRQANASIDHVNLNLTEEQWLEIDRICRNGESQLVIAYAGRKLITGTAANAASNNSALDNAAPNDTASSESEITAMKEEAR